MAEELLSTLSPQILEAIAEDQYKVHQKFWSELQALKRPGAIFSVLSDGGPRMPKLPLKLFGILGRYAISLLACERHYYPKGQADLSGLSSDSARRVEQLVMEQIALIEKPYSGLDYHATYQEMRIAVRETLTRQINALALPKPITFLPLPDSSSVPPDAVPESRADQPRGTPIKDQLRSLFDEAGLYPSAAVTLLKVTPKSIYRHINGDALPREEHLQAYERFFSDKLGRPIKLKRQIKVTQKSLRGKRSQ